MTWVLSSPFIRTTINSTPKIYSTNLRRSIRSFKTVPYRKSICQMSSLKVAVIGCTHGAIDDIFVAIQEIQKVQKNSIDLIICPGDFQAFRNNNDLQCMACPEKYRHLGSFWKYYAGHSVANIPIIFVGGNHEASNHLQEISYGGLVAPNIYYLGEAGVVNYRGLRIAGITGVYVSHNYEKERFEKPPYPKSQLRSVYHARKKDVDRMLRLQPSVDVFISHDWPRGIWNHGDVQKLLASKPFLRKEISENTLGNPGTEQVLQHLQPNYWFAAHMHVHFPALVKHSNTNQVTRFLALDKVLPRREFVQILDIPIPQEKHSQPENVSLEEFTISLDLEWLTILRTEALDPTRQTAVTMEEIEKTREILAENSIPTFVNPISDFEARAHAHSGNERKGIMPQDLELQPRTEALIAALGIKNGSNVDSGMNASIPSTVE